MELWGYLLFLCGNPFWRLHVAAGPLQRDTQHVTLDNIVLNVAEISRPTTVIGEYLGALYGGQLPHGVLIIDKYYGAHQYLRQFSMWAESLAEWHAHASQPR